MLRASLRIETIRGTVMSIQRRAPNMSPESVFVVGNAAIAILVGTVLFLPDSWIGRELRRAYHVQTTGVLGRFAPRDFGRAALMSLVIGMVLIAGAYTAISMSFDNQGAVSRVLEGYGFGFFLLGVVVLLSIVQTVWRGWQVLQGHRRADRLQAAHPELFASIREILARHNVLDLGGEELEAEFAYQASRLLGPVLESSSYEDLFAHVHGYYVVWLWHVLASQNAA